MNLLKRWRGHNQETGRNQALATRQGPAFGLSRFEDEIDQMFSRFWEEWNRDPWSSVPALHGAWPAVDIAEDQSAVRLHVDVPGLGPDDIDVQVSGNLLTISGSRNEERTDNKRGVQRRERRFGSFSRALNLPSYVDPSQLEARYDEGTLTITASKIAGAGPKRIPVAA